jgi:hypothetical protein
MYYLSRRYGHMSMLMLQLIYGTVQGTECLSCLFELFKSVESGGRSRSQAEVPGSFNQ